MIDRYPPYLPHTTARFLFFPFFVFSVFLILRVLNVSLSYLPALRSRPPDRQGAPFDDQGQRGIRGGDGRSSCCRFEEERPVEEVTVAPRFDDSPWVLVLVEPDLGTGVD